MGGYGGSYDVLRQIYKGDSDMMGELMDAVGALAEMALLFYKATINAGATEEQANILITAFLRASLQKNGKNKEERGDSGDTE